MKKITALLLCFICLFSTVAMSASAADGMDGIIESIGTLLGMEPDEPIGYGITYDSNKTYSGVTGVMYEPKPTVTIRNKGTYTITDDKPLAIDYNFVAWEDRDTGKLYYAGDKYFVTTQKTFYAVWEEKTDNYTRPIRVFLTAMEACKRSIQSFFNVFKVEFVEDPTEDVNDEYRFDLEPLFQKDYVYDYKSGTRQFSFKVKLVGENRYHTFSRTEDIYLGGTLLKTEEKVYEYDNDGNITGYKIKFVHTLQGDVRKVSALYETTGEVDANGYQTVTVTLTDGVTAPLSNTYVVFILPAGMFNYTDAAGKLHASNEYKYSILTSKDLK